MKITTPISIDSFDDNKPNPEVNMNILPSVNEIIWIMSIVCSFISIVTFLEDLAFELFFPCNQIYA
jgi:hypothetical protein